MPQGNPYDDVIRNLESRDATTNVMLQHGRNPADVARARRLARYTAAPAALIEHRPAGYELDVRKQDVDAAIGADAGLARWLGDPDNAALAQNDIPRLAGIGSMLQPWTTSRSAGFRSDFRLTDFQPTTLLRRGDTPQADTNTFMARAVRSGADTRTRAARGGRPIEEPGVTWDLERGVRGAAGMFAEAGLQAIRGATGIVRMISEGADQLGIPHTRGETSDRLLAGVDEALASGIEAVRPDLPFSVQRAAYSGLTSATQMAALAPFGAGATIGGLTGITTGEAYGRFRNRGAPVGEAAAAASLTGLVEYATERLPIMFLFNSFGREGAQAALRGFMIREFGGEQAATHLQDAIDVMTTNPDMTWDEYWASRPQATLDTLIATGVMVGAVGATGTIVSRFEPQRREVEQIGEASLGQQLLDDLMEQAAQSEVRTLDPQSFSDFVNSRTEGTPVQNVYIPVEAVRTYLQSEGADPTFFEPYARQIAEATRLNGDIVIPIGDAAAHLAGTPAWEKLREDARVSPGGLSGREARERSRTFMQELETRGAEIAQEGLAQSEEKTSAFNVYEQVRAQLAGIGRSEREADAIAQVVAARREAAGARLGVTAEEYHVANPLTFRQAEAGEQPGATALRQGTLIEGQREDNDIFLRYETADRVAHIHLQLREDGSAEISVDPFSTSTNHFGLAAIKDAARQLRNMYPEITRVEGERISGAGPGRTQTFTFLQEINKQQGDKVVRGQAQFYADRPDAIVTLFGDANLSTLIHELGHVFLEEMFRDAAAAGAPQALKDDADRIKKWFAANGHAVKKGKIPVEAHELFARGFETYAMEGKAPSGELRGAFAQFRAWLLRIYEVVQNLRAPITPEIREVMGRMLATDEAIAANTDVALPLFKDAKTAQMTDEEFAAYSASIAAARDEAYDALLFKTMAAIRRREQERFRTQRANVRAEVAAGVNSRPEFVALHLLRTGRWLNQPDREAAPVKLNTGWLIDTYGEDILNQLPRGLPIVHGAGVEGDVVAEMVGMASGDQLVKTLVEIRKGTDELRAQGERRSVREMLVEAETDRIMAERHGDAMTDGSIEEEAIAAINSARQGEIIAGEMRQLTKRKAMLGGPTPYRIAREWARRTVRAGRVLDVASRTAVQRYIRATQRAAKAAEEAILADDVDEAFRQKQAQLLNHALLAEAKIAADEIDIIVARMKRYAGRKAMQSVNQDYLDRIHELLERFDFRPRSQKAIDEQDSFEAWAARRQAEGFEVLTPPRLVDRGEHYSRVDVDTLAELNDAVSSLIHLGRLKQKLKDAQGEREFNEWRDEARANIARLPDRKLGDNPSSEKERRFVKLGVGGLKMEEIADELDVEDPNGPFNNLLIKRATEAANVKDALKSEILDPIAELYFGLSAEMRRWFGEKVTSDRLTWNAVNEGDPRQGQPVTMTRMEWLGVLLNTGNLSNLEKMTKGERWNARVVQDELIRIVDKKAAWDFVQALWNQVDTLWPRIAEGEREMSGVVPEAVEGLEIETPFGPYKGGYWPVVYDVGRSVRAANNEADAANDLFGFKSGIGTPKGHTITRTNAVGPMSYRLEEILFTHVERVATRIAYAEWARDVMRVVNNSTIAGIIKTKMGPEYLGQIAPWLRRQINGNMVDKRGSAELDRWMRGFRVNMSLAVMGLSVSTGMAQTLGLGQSASRIGAKWVGVGFRELVKAPFAMQEYIYERSPEMARRGREVNREIVEFFNTLNIERGKTATAKRWYRNAQRAAFWHIAWIDRWAVAMPTWLGAYHKGLSEGMTDEEASAYGDKMVRSSQGSGREKDLSAWQSPNNEANRFWTMFYSPFSVYLSMQWKAGRRMKRGNWRGAVQLMLWSTLAIALGDALQAGDWPWDDEEEQEDKLKSLALWFGRNVFFSLWSGVPVARDVANVTERHLIGEYAEMQTPIEAMYNAVDRAVKEGRQVHDGEEEISSETIRAEASAAGYVFGLPGNQIGKTGGFLYDLTTGAAEPQSIRDWYSGLAYGRLPEDEE